MKMKVVMGLITCFVLFAAWVAHARALFDPANKSRPRAATSVPQSEDPKSEWRVRHDAQVKAIAASDAPIMFFGDSIVSCWAGAGLGVWNRHFAEGEFKAVNYGSGGDRTQNAIWRVYHGPFATYRPKAIVLMIGTNNAGFSPYAEETTTDTAIGFKTLLDAIRALTPKSKIILCAIPPRGAKADDPVRLRNEKVNREIKKLADDRTVFWLDFGDQLTEPDGTISKVMMPDYLHPAEAGYRIWAKALLPALRRALAVPDGPRTCVPEGRTGEEWWLYWMRQKRGEIATFRGKTVDAVLLGDSITHFWDMAGKEELAKFREKMSVLPIGVAGDKTQHVLWRVENGDLDGYTARTVTLMIGTNNTSDTPEDIAAGIRSILDAIALRQPKAKIVLMPIFPRGKWQNDKDRAKNDKVNALIRPFADGKRIVWFDFTQKFLSSDGKVRKDLMDDYLHPTAAGYAVWRESAVPFLQKLLTK